MRVALLLLLGGLLAAQSKPCSTPTPDCTEQVPLGPAGRFSVVYRSHSLAAVNPRIERAFLLIHGVGRNAPDYFATAMASAFLAQSLDSTLVIAPRFAVGGEGERCNDTLAPGEISWSCRDNWTGAGAARDVPELNSYELIDALLRQLNVRQRFPHLRQIVVAGHSAGGQFVNRYAALGRAASQVPVRFVVSNPSSYVYLDRRRPAAHADCTVAGQCQGEFTPADAGSCGAVNQWRYGLEQRHGYAATVTPEQMLANFRSRDVVYLLGDEDLLPAHGFDQSCGAMAQGASRYQRGLNYWNYLRAAHGIRHKLVVAPACGHNHRCVFTADEALQVVFGKER